MAATKSSSNIQTLRIGFSRLCLWLMNNVTPCANCRRWGVTLSDSSFKCRDLLFDLPQLRMVLGARQMARAKLLGNVLLKLVFHDLRIERKTPMPTNRQI